MEDDSYTLTWAGDWHARVLERVRERGFASVTDYAANRRGVGLLDLAEEIGPHVAAVQIMELLVVEALATRTVQRALSDLLARELREALSTGWRTPLDDKTRSNVAGAIARWSAELRPHVDRNATLDAGKELLAAELPEGWRPADGDDPIVAAFVERCRHGRAAPS